MNKIVKLAAPLILIGTGAAYLYHRSRQSADTAPHIVIIPGNDPAFDPTMYNVLLVKRIDSGQRLAVIKAIRASTSCDLPSIKDLADYGGYICGLSDSQMQQLKAELEGLGAFVELK